MSLGLFLSFSVSNLMLVLALFVTVIIYFQYKYYNLPPGPWGIPVFGYLPFLGKFPERKLMALQKKYGNIFSMSMGSKIAIVLNDYKSIHEAFIKSDSFNDRPDAVSLKVEPDDYGLISLSGEMWKIHKRLVLRVFREHGVGKDSFETLIQKEIRQFLDVLADFKEKPFTPLIPILKSLSNILWHFEWGKQLHHFDKSFTKIYLEMYEYPNYIAGTDIRTLIPWIRFIPFVNDLTTQTRLGSIKRNISNFFKKRIEERKAAYEKDSRSNYIDAFITERNTYIKKSVTNNYFSDHVLIDILVDLYGAGINTLSISLQWMFALLMTHPKVQKCLQTEIDEIVGSNRYPCTEDRPYMPYTEAVILEVQRWASIVPINVFHCNSEEATLLGFQIPKRSFIVCNLRGVHHDPNVWKDPEVFRPERFIKNGKLEVPPSLIPFSIGKRACIGEKLAKIELFLYTTFVFQRYSIELPANESEISLEPEPMGILQKPKKFAMQVKRRNI